MTARAAASRILKNFLNIIDRDPTSLEGTHSTYQSTHARTRRARPQRAAQPRPPASGARATGVHYGLRRRSRSAQYTYRSLSTGMVTLSLPRTMYLSRAGIILQ